MTPTVRQAIVQSGLVPVDAQVLLAHALGCARTWLVAHADDPLPRLQADAFFALAKRRRAGEPVAYLTGTREFWGLALRLTPDVLSTTLHDSNFGGPLPVKIQSFTSPPRLTSLRA